MKRFILPLMILLFVGSLFAVESAPSEVVGYVKYDCVAGLNLVALPMEQGFTLSSEVGDTYPGQIDQISRWDADLQFWESAVFYDFGDGTGIWDPDFAVEPGSVIMISTTAPISFFSIGSMPNSNAQYAMISGLNTMMVPLNKSQLTLSSELGDEIGTVDQLSSWAAGLQFWESAVFYDFGDGTGIWDPDFNVSIGTPVMASVTSPTTWPQGPRGNNQGTLQKFTGK